MEEAEQRAAARRLRSGADELGLQLSHEACALLVAYLDDLARWNRAYNLTTVSAPKAAVPRHLLDSLSIAPHLHGDALADVGSGAGLPGVPLAILCPERQFTLIEPSARRVRFLRHVVMKLGLANTEVERVRAEDYRPPAGFDTVMSRAVSRLSTLVEVAGHLCAEGGRMLVMKGREPAQELAEVPVAWRVRGLHRLRVPQLAAERHLVVLERAGESQ